MTNKEMIDRIEAQDTQLAEDVRSGAAPLEAAYGQAVLVEMAHRIGKALGENLGGRFTVVANLSKEAGEPKRTIKVIDRWADPCFTLELRAMERDSI